MATAGETLHAKTREERGTKACRRLRDEGQVPAVLYGHEEKAVVLQVPYEELEAALRHHSRMIELRLDDRSETVLVKDVQYDAFGMQLVHADFQRVKMDETLEIEVPVILKGKPKEEHAVLQQMLDAVEVECLPGNIPEEIVMTVGEMTIGDSRHVADLEAPEGVKLISDPETVVATVTAARAEEVEEEILAEAAPGAEEPELIRPEREEEEEEEAGEE